MEFNSKVIEMIFSISMDFICHYIFLGESCINTLMQRYLISFLFYTQTQDEYIFLKKIGKPSAQSGGASICDDENGPKRSGLSKFDRYRHQDDEDEMDEGKIVFFSFCSFEKLSVFASILFE